MAYVLNQSGEPEDVFNWLEAFETWVQRRAGGHVNWNYSEIRPLQQWSATITINGRSFTGTGQNQQNAKKNAVIKIERAAILWV
ncbi:hypothetical protein B0J17DRAFT_715010 [Rhizoctonia solani]|nr:hypothetical protein B0J17DRAFT_715010 [Rhizoctonia solani]